MRISVALALLLVACGGNNQDVKTSTGNGGSSALGSSGAGAGAAAGAGGSPNMPGAGSGTMPGAGTGATDPHPPHVVGKCDGLGKVGEWEEISPPEMIKEAPYTGALMALVDANNAGVVYVATSKNGIFRSADCGASWKKTNTGRNGDKLDQGAIWSAALDPNDSDTIYAITGYGPQGLWKSSNAGVDWDDILPRGKGMPGFVARVAVDPTNHLHVMANFHDNCTDGHTPVCFAESKDGGQNWSVLDFPTSLKDGWGEGTFLVPLDETHWLFEYWELYYTGDAGKTWKQVDTGGAAAIQGPAYKAPNGTHWLASAQGVLMSEDGEKWTRIPDSFAAMDAITGCGSRVFSVIGFYPPSTNDYVFTATYQDPMKWTVLDTPGLPKPMNAGSNSVGCDEDHNILYTAAQAGGFWRVLTETPDPSSGGASTGGKGGGGGAGGASGGAAAGGTTNQ